MTNNELLHFDVVISGRVQGVGFRYSAVNQARKLGIRGFVKNLPTGQVRLEIEGSKTATSLMLDWCRKGPSTSRVEDVAVSEGNSKDYKTFEVRY